MATKKQDPPKQTPPSNKTEEPVVTFDAIEEVNEDNFAAFVLENTVPVILDCYANWCDPCKILEPKLRKAVLESNGALALAKLNIDDNQQLAQELRIQNIPHVYAFYKGKVIGQFQGVPQDDQLDNFIGQLLKLGGKDTSSGIISDANEFLKQNNVERAAQLFSQLLSNKTLKAEAIGFAGLARCALAEKNVEMAQELIGRIRKDFKEDMGHEEVKKAIAALEVELSQHEDTSTTELQEKVKANPNDMEARYELALAYQQAGRHSQALDQCFQMIRKNKHWKEDAARKLCLSIFETLGPKEDIVKEGRKRLSNLWFV